MYSIDGIEIFSELLCQIKRLPETYFGIALIACRIKSPPALEEIPDVCYGAFFCKLFCCFIQSGMCLVKLALQALRARNLRKQLQPRGNIFGSNGAQCLFEFYFGSSRVVIIPELIV